MGCSNLRVTFFEIFPVSRIEEGQDTEDLKTGQIIYLLFVQRFQPGTLSRV